VVQHQAQEKLRAENESLTQQIAQLKTDNESLSNRLAAVGDSKSLTDEQLNELLRLRSEVTRLQADSEQLAHLKAADAQKEKAPTEAIAKFWLDRVDKLKQRLNRIPNEKIPELQFLMLQDWLHAAELNDLETDDDFLKAFSDLRASAKNTFGKMMHSALWNYAHSNDGMLPTNIFELQSYFKPPVNETILRRYELLPTGEKFIVTPNGLVSPPTAFSPTGFEKPLVLEKAPVDKKYDTRLEVSMGLSGALGLEYYSYTNGIPLGHSNNLPSGN
jgi:hypothetical protein